MFSEKNLDKLLRNMQPEMHAGEFVFCVMPGENYLMDHVNPVCIFYEKEGMTLILPRSEAIAQNFSFDLVFKMITLNVHSSLDSVGFIAVISTRLSTFGISVNPISAYYHDHLFVPCKDAEKAMKILKELEGS